MVETCYICGEHIESGCELWEFVDDEFVGDDGGNYKPKHWTCRVNRGICADCPLGKFLYKVSSMGDGAAHGFCHEGGTVLHETTADRKCFLESEA